MISARALRAGKAVIELSLLTGNVDKGLKKLENRMRDFGKGLKSIASMGLRLSAAIGAPFIAAIKLASDAQESLNKFRAVFKEQADAAEQFAQGLSKSVGRSVTEIRDGMSAFQGFFVGLGFAADHSRQLSEQLQVLSIDFASFHNLTDAEAMERFISALSGSSEVLDRFGINTKQAALQQELLNMGVNKSWTAVTEQEKAVARLNVIMRAMTDQGAVGDAVRTAGSLANRLKTLKAKVSDVAVEIGTALIPAATELITKALDVSKRFGTWAKDNKDLIVTIAELTLKLGLLSAALYAVGTAASVAAKSIGALRIALNFLIKHPVLAALAAIAAAFVWLMKKIKEARGEAADFNKQMGELRRKQIQRPRASFELSPEEQRQFNAGNAKRTPIGVPPAMRKMGLPFDPDDPFAGVEAMPAGSRPVRGANGAFVGGILNKMRDVIADAQVKAQAKIMRAQMEMHNPLERVKEFIADLTEKTSGAPTEREGIFSTKFAAQIFGGRDEQLEQLRQIARNTDPRNQNGQGGLPVV